jgi:Kae1-associated kinase Bud32
MERELIRIGAEATISRTTWRGRPVVVKRRVAKGYRISELDEIMRRQRTKREVQLMAAARAAGVPVPIVYDVSVRTHEIVMQYIPGPRLKDVIDEHDETVQRRWCAVVGEHVARLHAGGMVHGDLTTSNMLVWKDDVFLIDFGLAGKSDSNEDRGVDLHLLKEACTAAHKNPSLFPWMLSAYEHAFPQSRTVVRKIDAIAARGRYTKKEVP